MYAWALARTLGGSWLLLVAQPPRGLRLSAGWATSPLLRAYAVAAARELTPSAV